MDINAPNLIFLLILWQSAQVLSSVTLSHLLNNPSLHPLIPDKSARRLLQSLAPPYIVSTIHAVFVTFRGIQHLTRLFNAPPILQLIRPPPHILATLPLSDLPYVVEIDRVLTTNAIFASYLITDLIHVIRLYPRVGGLDTILHHLAFAGCALVAGSYRLYPFMFGWLIIGEASTSLLNLRWLLIKAGKGSTFYFKVIQFLFALVFTITRIFIYATGLVYQLSILRHVLPLAPFAAVVSTMGFVVVGFVINLMWMGKIYKLAMGRGKKPCVTASASRATVAAAKKD